MYVTSRRLFLNGGASDQASTSPTSDQASQTAPQAAATATGDQVSQAGKTPADLERIIAELRRENASHRTENVALKKYKEDAEAAKLSETEKAQKAVQDAQAEKDRLAGELRAERGKNAVTLAAAKVGVSPEIAAKLLTVTFDDAGQPQGVEDALRALVQQHPYLLLAGGEGTSAGNPAGRHGGATITPEGLKNMTPAQINANWDTVKASLKK